MANLTEDELHDMMDKARADETERCALLNEELAIAYEANARRIREEGSVTTRALWPPFKKITVVAQRWERVARDVEQAANSLRVVARCIRMGYDPRKPRADERIDTPIQDIRERNIAEAVRTGTPCQPVPNTSNNECLVCGFGPCRGATRVWRPCSECTSPMDCGSWQTCMGGKLP